MEDLNNIGGICNKHANQRHKEWQENNSETVIKVGDHVKIKFNDSGNHKSEHMWVLITDVGPKVGVLRGTIDNDPVVVTNYMYGQQVKIKRSDISEHIKNS